MNIKSARRKLNMSLSEFAELHRMSTDAIRADALTWPGQ